MIHNLWYTTLGALQWVGWEVLFLRGWALGYFDFMSDAEAFGSIGGWARMAAYSCFVPLWRDFHFYFAHRFLHIRCLYKFVHVLHHRNKEIEPWSGLCMHPIEHLYYFACVAPSMYLRMHPFHLWWHGVHLLLSPAASHSGWEDHFQSDQFHYLHHKRFECNYGSSGTALDKIFGTFRERMGKSKTYRGAAKSITAPKQAMKEVDPKSSLCGLPPADQLVFNLFSLAVAALVVCATLKLGNADKLHTKFSDNAQTVAFIAAFGPIIASYCLTIL